MAIEAVDGRVRGLGSRGREQQLGLAVVRRLDWLLVAAVGGALAYGLWAIDGITRDNTGGSSLSRQGVYAAVGLVLLVVAIFVDPARYRAHSQWIYGSLVGLLFVVLALGAATRGSKRWIDLKVFTFQPSEFGKVFFALALAGFLSSRDRVANLRSALTAVALALPPILLVFVQPDFGTALVYMAVLFAVLFTFGLRWSQLAGGAAIVAILACAVLWWLPAAGIDVLKPYQAARLTGFTHPGSDPRSATYQVTQSIITVGAGGLRGRGVHGATQTGLGYLPEDSTDFAFASLAEQRGFSGAAILLLLYLLIVWRGIKAITAARDRFSALAAAGIVFGFLFQVFVNVGMTIGVAPVTGIPLPFVSVGGSSMISNLLGMGILLSIHARGGRRRLA